MSKRFLIIGTIIVALFQTAVLAKIVTDRAATLEGGKEVVLETGFIDPRDLFRGHYTNLNFTISQVDRKEVEFVGKFAAYDTVYVELEETEPFAKIARIFAEYPANPKGPILKGKAQFASSETRNRLRISFPFRRFYAARDRALELQDMQRERKLGVILSVADDGTAMIKGLTIEGEKIYEEPLY
jgi:uncharacterized membrane-anchored protein